MAQFNDINPSSISPSSSAINFYDERSLVFEPREIYKFDRLMELWGFVHIVEDSSVELFGPGRKLYRYELSCGREYQDDKQARGNIMYRKDEQPVNACPGCSKRMEVVDRWR